MKSSIKIVRDIIDKFGPDDLATIVFTADSRQAQDFTNDRTRLLAALDKFAPSFAVWRFGADTTRGYDSDVQFMLGSVNTIRNVLDTLALIPNTRKTLIWVTPGVPVDFDMAGPVKVPNPVKPDDRNMMGVMSHRHLIDRTKEIFESAKSANVPIYPIDPTGLAGLSTELVKAPPEKAMRSQDHMLMTAANTGGHAIINTNEFRTGIESIFEENGSYYLIGYNPTNTNADGTLRKIEVKVNRADVEGHGRRADTSRRSRAPLLRRRSMRPWLGPSPRRFRCATYRCGRPSRHLRFRADATAAVVIALGVRQPVPESAATGRVTVTTELQTSAFTTEGDLRGSQRHTAKVQLRAGAQGDADYEALSRIDLPPGRYRLRLAAYHDAAGKTGTVSVDVYVPDFNRDAASMSGVVISADAGATVRAAGFVQEHSACHSDGPAVVHDEGTRDRDLRPLSERGQRDGPGSGGHSDRGWSGRDVDCRCAGSRRRPVHWRPAAEAGGPGRACRRRNEVHPQLRPEVAGRAWRLGTFVRRRSSTRCRWTGCRLAATC